MKLENIVTDKAVKSMTIPETLGAGLLGGVADSAISLTIGQRLPTVATAGIEIAGGILIGSAAGGKLANIAQNGLIITGCNKLVNLGTAYIMGLTAGNSANSTAAANTETTSDTLY